MFCRLNLCDIITSKDGSTSLTKLAAATAHFSMACAFVCITLKNGFVLDMWAMYGGFAIGHATVDKSVAMLKDYKESRAQ